MADIAAIGVPDEGEALFDAVLKEAQVAGIIDSTIGAAEIGRFVTMVALGARLTSALDLPAVDQEEWSGLIERLVNAVRSPAG